MKVLGIDPGIANVGFGIIERHSRCQVIASGCLITNPRMSQSRRIYSIARRIKYLIEATEPDVIVVEDFIPFRQRKNMGNISQAYGAIQYVCIDSRTKLVIVRPNTWMRRLLRIDQTKKFSKLHLQRYVNRELKVRTRVEHEAEALGIALYYLRGSR